MKKTKGIGKIKILFIIDYLVTNTAGTENQLLKLINHLNKNKYELHLVCLQNTDWIQANRNTISANIKILDYDVYHHFSINNLKNLYALIRYIRDISPHLVFTFFKTSSILGVLSARLAGSKTIIASRRDYGDGLEFKDVMLLRFSNLFLKAIITNSTPVKELTCSKEKFARDKIIVMHNGIEINGKADQFKNVRSIKSNLNIPSDRKIVGIVANLRAMKRHITVIRAAAEILKSETNISFILVGDGQLRKDLEDLSRQYKVQDHVYFAGSQTDVLPYLKTFDIGINCSANEGMSNAIMEYMIYGVPSVVSYAGGNPELIENGVNGFTFKLDHYKELAEKILILLNDKELQIKFVNESQKKIQSKFSIENMINSYDDLFEKLVYDC